MFAFRERRPARQIELFFPPFFVHPPWFRALVRDEFFSEGEIFSRQKISLSCDARCGNIIFTMLLDPCNQAVRLVEGNNAWNSVVRPTLRRWRRTHERNSLSRGSRRLLRRIEHEDEEKWRVFATSRREKRGRAFLRKVGREGIRLYTHTRRGVGHPPRRPCLKRRTWLDRFHIYVTVFRRAFRRPINRNRVFSLSDIGRVTKCVATGRGLNPLMCQERPTECNKKVYAICLTIRNVS